MDQESKSGVMRNSGQMKKKTLLWAMTTLPKQPMFLCNATPPHAVEHVNALWCDKTGFPSRMIKGSHGLSLLKGPLTDEDLVARAWAGVETTITVIHYTGNGSMVNHTIHVIPLFEEQGDKISHFLGISSFEKYISKGNLYHRAKAVMNTNILANFGKHKESALPFSEQPAGDTTTCIEDRQKNIHLLRKENALKHLSEYADTLSESVKSKIPLTTLKVRRPKDDSQSASALTKNLNDKADRINAFKARLQAAKRQAKREKLAKSDTPTASCQTSSVRGESTAGSGISRGLKMPTAHGVPVVAATSHQQRAADMDEPKENANDESVLKPFSQAMTLGHK